MAKKMLIDAVHPEETRVVVMNGNRLEDFDFESKVKKSYKSNIYLAKVTRVEPSLQAAFVNYGGNRHGFLPFSEIHPDYYRIPIEDRKRLMEEQEELARKIAERAEAKEDEGDDPMDEAEIDALIEEVNAELDAVQGNSPESEFESQDEGVVADDKSEKKSGRRRTRRKNKDSRDADDRIDSDIVEDDKSAEDDKAENDSDKTEQEFENGADEPYDVADNADNAEDENGEDKKNYRNKKRYGKGRYRGRRGRRGGNNRKYSKPQSDRSVDSVGGDDFDTEADPVSILWKKMRRSYKIQEVIKRGQVMLVQCQKEERGQKGAAMTTYITLPGRHGVLMPNSPRGGGISRKIGWSDRKKLKTILKEVTIPKGMSVILRTAAVGRTKTEIKRDLDYLYKLWDSIRELTLKSNAPALVYEEGQLIKRAIRDIYSREIDEVIVAGDEGYKETKNVMKMMIPSHAKRVKPYKEETPIFMKYNAEAQIDEIYDTEVTLKSGGYLVIHPTEALVSVDVNSGKSIKERNVEGTALRTNKEAAQEVARQLRLRDLGGLVVIDFIDMEDYRNNREVERVMTEALSTDRARVQVGRISNFGLMELSRQRLRPSLMETHFETCHHCDGAGTVRTKETAAIRVLRMIEEEAMKAALSELRAEVPSEVGLYIMNYKREALVSIEERYDFKVFMQLDDNLTVSELNLTPVKGKKPHSKDSGTADAQTLLDDEDLADKMAEEEDQEQTQQAEVEESNPQGQSKSGAPRRDGKKTSAKKQNTEKEKSANSDQKDAPPQQEDKDSKSKKPARGRKKAQDTSKTDEYDGKQTDVSGSTELKEVKEPPQASNENLPEEPEVTAKAHAAPPKPKDYEVVNQAPEKKKKGWWNNLLDA